MLDKQDGQVDSFLVDLVVNNQISDPLLNKPVINPRSRSDYPGGVEGKVENAATEKNKLKNKLKESADTQKESGKNKKKRSQKTQQIGVSRPGVEPSDSSSSSGSSSLTSSVYSSTISSHLSGDEQIEKHHITDVYAEKDNGQDEDTPLNPVPSRISERESESSSVKIGQEQEAFSYGLIDSKENLRRRSSSVNQLQKSRVNKAKAKTMSQSSRIEARRSLLVEEQDDEDSEDDSQSDTSFSLSSLSDRSDLDQEQVERLVRRYYQKRNMTWTNLSFFEKIKIWLKGMV